MTQTIFIVMFGMINSHDQTILGTFESEEEAKTHGEKHMLEGGYAGNPNFQYQVIPQEVTRKVQE